MLSETELKSDDFLSKAIKKSYQGTLIPTIQGLMDTIESQRLKIETLTADNKILQNDISHQKELINSKEYRMALTIKEWIASIAESTIRNKVPSIVRKQVVNHLNVNVETEAEYDPYSGSRDPYYTSSADISWK